MASGAIIRRVLLFFALFMLLCEDFTAPNRTLTYAALTEIDNWFSATHRETTILKHPDDAPNAVPTLREKVEILWNGGRMNINRLVSRLRNLREALPAIKHIILFGETGKVERPYFVLQETLSSEISRREKSSKFKADQCEFHNETRVPTFIPAAANITFTAQPPISEILQAAKALPIPGPAQNPAPGDAPRPNIPARPNRPASPALKPTKVKTCCD